MQCTLAMIKPDAVKAGKAAEIQQLMQLFGFSIITKKQIQVRSTQHGPVEWIGELHNLHDARKPVCLFVYTPCS